MKGTSRAMGPLAKKPRPKLVQRAQTARRSAFSERSVPVSTSSQSKDPFARVTARTIGMSATHKRPWTRTCKLVSQAREANHAADKPASCLPMAKTIQEVRKTATIEWRRAASSLVPNNR